MVAGAVPGRKETVDFGRGATGLVKVAHEPNSTGDKFAAQK